MYKVKLSDGNSFSCEDGEFIVQGALRNGVFLEHSCLAGRCSSCKFKVLSGVTHTDSDELPLTQEDKEGGFILACVRQPVSDIELDAEDLSSYGLSNPRRMPAKIVAIESLTDNILRVVLRFPPNQSAMFTEGQYADVSWKGITRSYSIASYSGEPYVELVIKNYPRGQMSAYWFGQAKEGDLLRLQIPKGTFFLRDHKDIDNIIFVATGTGIAPIKAILENPENQRKLSLYDRVLVLWGMRYESELFWKPDPLVADFLPVLSREGDSKRYVQHELGDLELDFSKTAVYACGSDAMIQDAKLMVLEKGLQEQNFFSDAFVASN